MSQEETVRRLRGNKQLFASREEVNKLTANLEKLQAKALKLHDALRNKLEEQQLTTGLLREKAREIGQLEFQMACQQGDIEEYKLQIEEASSTVRVPTPLVSES